MNFINYTTVARIWLCVAAILFLCHRYDKSALVAMFAATYALMVKKEK